MCPVLSVGFCSIRGGLVPFWGWKAFKARFFGSCFDSVIPNPYAESRKKLFFVLCKMFPNLNFGCTMKFYKISGNAMFNLIDALGLVAYASPVFLSK